MFDLMRPTFSELRREMDRLLETVASDVAPAVRTAWGAPAMDLLEDDNQFILRADLPGVNREDIEIQVANGVLHVSGERKPLPEDENRSYYLFERRYGKFARAITLPASVGSENIQATFRDGVLTVTLPKTEEARPRRIQVTA